ncbi:SRPBCC family protein [Myxococcus sp. AM010]|uniref:SRPBCC family protein n=1 Tax=Myxococcus sp. AM010 TaxID=2745138 RepID=UPI001595677C|nr:SRPBCC family protein [Myxococcus sp. AM010]NVJ15221.1 SRPBCC family protein [Myxococcus sp. AM010]
MTMESTHISVRIARSSADVYAYASQPRNLPAWAAGLSKSVHEADGHWVSDAPMGRVTVAFAPANAFGVLDHDVTLPNGETVYNPVRVIPDGDHSEVIFTLRRRDGTSAEASRRDAEAVAADLERLKALLEGQGTR